jgi:hypothetical protein
METVFHIKQQENIWYYLRFEELDGRLSYNIGMGWGITYETIYETMSEKIVGLTKTLMPFQEPVLGIYLLGAQDDS